MNEAFKKLTHAASHAIGTAYAFIAALALLLVWPRRDRHFTIPIRGS